MSLKSFELIAKAMYAAHQKEVAKHSTAGKEWEKLSQHDKNAWVKAAWAANKELQGVL